MQNLDLQEANLMAPTITRVVTCEASISLFLRTQLVLKSLQQLLDMDSKKMMRIVLNSATINTTTTWDRIMCMSGIQSSTQVLGVKMK